jgi:hypothetical protein
MNGYKPVECQSLEKDEEKIVLKTDKLFFDYIWNYTKNVEIRLNDRQYKPNMRLTFIEWDPILQKYGNRHIEIIILWVNSDYIGLKENYCMFGFLETNRGYYE